MSHDWRTMKIKALPIEVLGFSNNKVNTKCVFLIFTTGRQRKFILEI